MAERILPGLGLTGFWDLGTNTWKPGMDANLRLLSVIVRGWVKSRATAIPESGVLGDVYIVPSDAAEHPNEIAIWDGETGAEDWVYVTPQIGLRFYVEGEAKNYQWNGAAWAEIVTAGNGGTTLPAIASGDAGKALIVNPGEDGYLYGAAGTGPSSVVLLPIGSYPTNANGLDGASVSGSAFALKGNLYSCTENLTVGSADIYIDNDTEGGSYQLHVLRVDDLFNITAVTKVSTLTFSGAASEVVSFPLDNIELAAGSKYAFCVVATNDLTFVAKVPFLGDGFNLPGLSFETAVRTANNAPAIGDTLASTVASVGMVLRYATATQIAKATDVVAASRPLRSATVTMNDQTLDLADLTVLSWNNEVQDTDGFWDGAAPTQFKIPAGVTKVRLHA
ncbi:MAG: DUF2793 domain-containing protein, partial [Geminicoccaceae bacterium]